MKSLLIVTLCAIMAVSHAEIDHQFNNKYGQHYTQHEDSVAKAREGLQQRLSTTLYDGGDAGAGSGYSINRYTSGGSSGNNKYVTGCSTCYGIGNSGNSNANSFSSRLSSSSSSVRSSSSSRSGIEGSDYLGVGTVGHSADNDDLQQRHVQPDLSNIGSSSTNIYRGSASSQKYTGNTYEDDDDLQQRHVQPDLSNIGSSTSTGHRGSASSQKYTGNAYEDDDDLQQRHVQPDLSNVGIVYRSSASRTNEEKLQRNSGSTYVPVYQRGGTGQNSYSSRQESASETRTGSRVPAAIPAYSSQSSRGSTSNSDSEFQETRTGSRVPAAIPIYNSVSQSSRGSTSNSDSEFQETRTLRPVVHPGQYVQVQARPGQTVVLSVPVRAGEQQQQFTSGRSEYTESTNKVQPTNYKITYRPTTTYAADKAASSSDLERTRVGYTPTQTRVVYQPVDQNRVVYQPADQVRQQPEKYVSPDIVSYGSYAPDSASLSTQQRYGANEENEQIRVAQVQITGPTDTRYTSTSNAAGNRGHVSNTRIVPSNTVVSSSSSRTNEEREERSRTQSRPTYVVPSRTHSSTFGSNNHDESSYGNSASINSLSQTQSQNQRTGSSGYSSQGVRIPSYSSSGSTREGSGVLSTSSDDLSSYMSESQRLAEQQSRQISSGSRGSFGVANAEAANRITLQKAANHQSTANQYFNSRNSDLDLADVGASAIGNGGAYQQSWQKQSKWASGSEYGTDGQPKTYSHLTTAESEKHKINGHEEGYKAATTTLENDGKVSTYSIRTP